MLNSHVFWALLGMLGYSATTLLVKFAARSGLPSTVVVAISTSADYVRFGSTATAGRSASLAGLPPRADAISSVIRRLDYEVPHVSSWDKPLIVATNGDARRTSASRRKCIGGDGCRLVSATI